MLRGLFARRAERPDPSRVETERVKRIAAALLDLPPGSALTASQINCPDPACPGDETILLILRPGEKTRAVKVAMATVDITEQDVRTALVEAGEIG